MLSSWRPIVGLSPLGDSVREETVGWNGIKMDLDGFRDRSLGCQRLGRCVVGESVGTQLIP